LNQTAGFDTLRYSTNDYSETRFMMKTFTNNLRLFWQGALLSYIALFHWMRPIQYMASKILMPLAQMFFFVYLGTYATSADNRSFYIVGNLRYDHEHRRRP
jgi:hypothetical protein